MSRWSSSGVILEGKRPKTAAEQTEVMRSLRGVHGDVMWEDDHPRPSTRYWLLLVGAIICAVILAYLVSPCIVRAFMEFAQ